MAISHIDFDVHQHEELVFPKSLPEFQKLFPDDAACAAYLERIRWRHGFACPHCGLVAEPFRFAARPGVLRCRGCRRDVALTVGTIMERTKTPLSVWFWAAYLVSTHTAGMSALQFQRQLGLKRYETAFQLLHKLRAGMVRSDADRIGSASNVDHVEVDEVWIGGATKGEGRGNHNQTLVAAAVEVRQRQPKEAAKPRRSGRYAGRLRLQVIQDRSAKELCGFVEGAVAPGAMVVTDGWRSYAGLADLGYEHFAAIENGDAEVTEEYLPIVHLVFSNLKTWLLGCHHGVSPQHLQAYLNEFTFRFNRRFYPFNAFRSLLGIGSNAEAPTYRGLYDGEWVHPVVTGGHHSEAIGAN
jgi:transposase-like protein